jgi:hypothetical protein
MCTVLLPPGVNQMCAVLLPPGVNPIAIKYIYICYHIILYHIISPLNEHDEGAYALIVVSLVLILPLACSVSVDGFMTPSRPINRECGLSGSGKR